MTYAITRRGMLDFYHLSKYDYSLDEIVETLSGLVRFNGHRSITVLAHSYAMSLEAERLGLGELTQFRCLVHDFHEAYIGDITHPIAAYFDAIFPGFAAAVNILKARIDEQLASKLAWPEFTADSLHDTKRLDEKALWLEAVHRQTFGSVGGYVSHPDFINRYRKLLAALTQSV